MKLTKIGLAFLTALMFVSPVYADSEKEYLVLGADLTASEKQKVYKILGVEDEADYEISYVTHSEEHQYLDSYISQKQIGSRALSSALLRKAQENAGITIETTNITYCTKEMYQNALITAGVKDVDVKIAAPFKISGTAALVASIKSYEIMTGKTLNEDNIDAANHELALTQEIGQEIGKDDAADLVAAMKQKMAAMGDDYTREKGEEALEEVAQSMGITIDDETKQKLLDLLDQLKHIDLNVEDIKTQAKNIYDKISQYTDKVKKSGILEKIGKGLVDLIHALLDLFN